MGEMTWIFGRRKRRRFNEQKTAELLAHLDAAYTLARCLTADRFAAENAVQEAFLSVSRAAPGVRAPDVRVSVLTMVRNTCLRSDRSEPFLVPETNAPSLEDALYSLPPEFREVLFLREGCELSYPQISKVVNAPVRIVVSRLSRARIRLYESLLSKPETNIRAKFPTE